MLKNQKLSGNHLWCICRGVRKEKKKFGSGGIRTHATFVTGALNQRLRPLGHATLLTCVVYMLALQATAYTSLSELVQELGWTELRAQSILVSKISYTIVYMDHELTKRV